MKPLSAGSIPTLGVLAAWQLYEGTTIDGYLHMLFTGIRAAAQDWGCNLLLSCGVAPPSPRRLLTPGWPVAMPDTQFLPVGPWNTDGLVVVPNGLSPERLRYIRDLMAGGHPVVFAGAPELAPTVTVDNAHGIDQAIAHLVAHGHRRIAFIGGPVDRPGDGVERLEAYRAALQWLALEADPRLVAHSDQADDIESGRQAMLKILAAGVPFTGLLTYNDWVAIGAMEALRSSGIETPRDVAIIGFDDRLHARVQNPPLTTVRHPTSELGYQSLVALLNLMDGEWDGKVPIRIPTRLIVRQSCGCGPGFAVVPATAGEQPAAGMHSLPRRMAAAAAAEARRLSFAEVEAICERLVAVLAADPGPDQITAPFSILLADVLQETLAREEEVYIWHAAISVLQEADAAAGSAGSDLPARKALLDQAQLTISEHSRRQSTGALIHEMEMAERLGLMTSQLLAVLDAEQIAAILAEYLPSVGIRHAHAALFMPGEDDEAAASQSILCCGPEGGALSTQFVTRRFPDSASYPPDAPCRLAVLPLIIQGTNAGFMAFDAANLEPCAVVMRNVAAALRSSQLYRDAAEGRRLAEEANRLKSRFLSTVSHELRTPLNVIVGLSELLLREQSQDPDLARQDLGRIYTSAQHLGFLIRDVLDLASSDAGQLRLSREPLDLVEIMQPVAATGEQLAADRGLAWRVQMPPNAPFVSGDRTRLRQVALNFISNAVKFTPRGEVTLALVAEGAQVTVSVSDTGLGIPAEEQESIFDEFRQSERTAARGFGGLGLGLAISRHLIELHGGEIGVRSSGVEGEGATFYFRLPIIEPPEAPAQPALPQQGPALVLTDERAADALLMMRLRDQGYEVVMQMLSDETDWRQRVTEIRPSAILLDRALVAEWGWRIVRALQENPATVDTPVIFYSLPPAGQPAAVLEFDYRLKPLNQDQLARLIGHGAAGAAPKTILVVDDDPAVLDLHTRLIARQAPDVRVRQARDGREALTLVVAERPDLILLDLMMPELDGFGVLEALRSSDATRAIPVVVLTARVLSEADMVRLNHGVVNVLEKGVFSTDEVLARVVAVLGRSEGQSGPARRLVRKAMAYLHEHYAEPISRGQLARQINVSESYLADCFHQELGISPMTYLTRYRVKQARSLLEAGELNVTEVAGAVGFSDSAYFGRVFQREVGVSPGAYRRGQRE
jgi:signal transduction histidine kinase/DNA-binding response OmpR family regulator